MKTDLFFRAAARRLCLPLFLSMGLSPWLPSAQAGPTHSNTHKKIVKGNHQVAPITVSGRTGIRAHSRAQSSYTHIRDIRFYPLDQSGHPTGNGKTTHLRQGSPLEAKAIFGGHTNGTGDETLTVTVDHPSVFEGFSGNPLVFHLDPSVPYQKFPLKIANGQAGKTFRFHGVLQVGSHVVSTRDSRPIMITVNPTITITANRRHKIKHKRPSYPYLHHMGS